MKISKLIFILVIYSAILLIYANTEDDNELDLNKHSLETSPVSPFLQISGAGIWALE